MSNQHRNKRKTLFPSKKFFLCRKRAGELLSDFLLRPAFCLSFSFAARKLSETFAHCEESYSAPPTKHEERERNKWVELTVTLKNQPTRDDCFCPYHSISHLDERNASNTPKQGKAKLRADLCNRPSRKQPAIQFSDFTSALPLRTMNIWQSRSDMHQTAIIA